MEPPTRYIMFIMEASLKQNVPVAFWKEKMMTILFALKIARILTWKMYWSNIMSGRGEPQMDDAVYRSNKALSAQRSVLSKVYKIFKPYSPLWNCVEGNFKHLNTSYTGMIYSSCTNLDCNCFQIFKWNIWKSWRTKVEFFKRVRLTYQRQKYYDGM